MGMPFWIKLSYSRRLFVWLVSYSIMLVGCFIFFQYGREREFKTAELNSQLQLINRYIARELEDGRPFDTEIFASAGRFDDLRISIIDSIGEVVYDNSLDRLPEANHFSRKEISEARERGEGFTIRRHSESTGDSYFYSATMADGGIIIRTAVPYTMSLTRMLKADYTFVWIMGAVALLFCVFGYFATSRVGLYITRLKDFAASAERGERITETEPFPHDEIGDISNNIVRLYARLQHAMAQRDREHASAMYQQQEKERIKKQLTNNINHELKTPVTSIQLCLETLQSHPGMSEDKRQEFIDRCMANADRLKRLLEDVALITRMDDGGKVIMRERVDLTAIINSVADECKPGAAARGMTIVSDIEAEIIVNGNKQLLESMFYNLIDNAVAYSGGTEIDIQCCKGEERVAIMVSDNGCGVAAEHIPHIFERFYRVDKGRSRASGGTGLGLAIVKNAVHFHGGTVNAENRSAGGLLFTIILPTVH